MTEDRPLIVIADDQPENLFILEELLHDSYRVQALDDGRQVLAFMQAGNRPDLLLLDVVMPGADGFEVCRRVKADPATRDIPVIFITSLESDTDEEYGLSLGAEDFVHKPFSPAVVMARVRNHLALAHANRELRGKNEDLERLVEERTREIVRRGQQIIAAQGATIGAFCALAEVRDGETGNHIRRTQHYMGILADKLRTHPRFSSFLDEETIQLMFKCAPLHDIGKVAIPDSILQKPGRFTPEEWAIMQRHAQYGRDAIARAADELHGEEGAFLRHAMEIASGHHERWDGSGYPLGLAGEAIPISARLMAVADVYDALISRRVYKRPFSHEEAVAMIAAGRASHFDPDIVDAFLEVQEVFHAIASRYSDA
ncbi:MAG: response regulator [Rhodocyclaceae bacterium]|nr:response regulator [Rhodocyclaceae bacterium]